MAGEAAKIPPSREDDMVIILDLVDHKVSLAKRGRVKATQEHYLGRAPNTGSTYRLLESKRGLIIADLNLSQQGWDAWWKRSRGRCNDIYSADALHRPEQEPEQNLQRQKMKDPRKDLHVQLESQYCLEGLKEREQNPQRQNKDPQKDLHTQPGSQVFSCSSEMPPPPYAP